MTDVILKVTQVSFLKRIWTAAEQTKMVKECNVFQDLVLNCEEAMKCTPIVLLLLRLLPAIAALEQSSDGNYSLYLGLPPSCENRSSTATSFSPCCANYDMMGQAEDSTDYLCQCLFLYLVSVRQIISF